MSVPNMILRRPMLSDRIGIHKFDKKLLNAPTLNTRPVMDCGTPNELAKGTNTGKLMDMPMNSVATAIRTKSVAASFR